MVESSSNQDRIREFSVLSSYEIVSAMQSLATQYPQLVTLTSSQEEYNLPAAGHEKDCPFDREGTFPVAQGCKNYILIIQDTISHPKGSWRYRTLPEVFLSGALHGDERVGPTAVLELARIVVQAADCEAKPKRHSAVTAELFHMELQERRQCIQDLYQQGVTDAQRQWLARLAATRRIVIVPTANAVGYFRNQREEVNIDANRDFPYDLQTQGKVSHQCMQTIAGRTINEIFRQHIFQISLTFHGGMEVIAYEWGAPSYDGGQSISPDDAAQQQIATGYSLFSGRFGTTPDYNYGAMNPLVYPVRGGMEDWAYAASWDVERSFQCNPTQYGGYNTSQTTYTTSMLRVINMLVETSNYKTPLKGTLGTTENLLSPKVDELSNGHIARNIRLALMAVDVVEPYVSIQAISDNYNIRVDLTAETIVPYDNRTFCNPQDERMVFVPHNISNIIVEWTAGGGFNIDSTYAIHTKWDNISNKYGCDPDSQRNFREDEISSSFKRENVSSGRTRWHQNGAEPSTTKESYLGGPIFTSTIDVTQYSPGDKIALFAVSTFDGLWKNHPKMSEPFDMPPTSHIVNARTDATWFHQVEDKVIQGYTHWYSPPVTLILGYKDGDARGDTLQLLNSRFNVEEFSFNTTDPKSPAHTLNRRGSYLTLFACIIVVCTAVLSIYLHRRSRYRRQRVSTDENEDTSDSSNQDIRNQATNFRDIL